MSLSRVNTRNKGKEQERRKRIKKVRLSIFLASCMIIGIIVVAVVGKGELIMTKVKDQFSGITLFQSPSDKLNKGKLEIHNDTEVDLPSDDDEGVALHIDEEIENSHPPEIIDEDAEKNELEQSNEQEESIADDDALISLAFVGDLLLGEYIQTWLTERGYDYPFDQARFHLSSAHITAGNLEMPITKRGTPADKTYVFKGDPAALEGLVNSGIDLVSLANNHTLDQGIEGLTDTIEHLDNAGIHHVGAGNDELEAYAPHYIEKNGIKVAYLAASHVLPVVEWKATKYQAGLAEAYATERIIAAIEDAKRNADIVVVLVHWGKERESSPIKSQVTLGHAFIDAGADIVVGSHPHVLQGFEQYNGKWIAYSLGNFVFSSYPVGKQAETGVLNAECSKDAHCEISFSPMKIINAQPTPLEGEEAKKLLSSLEEVSLGNLTIHEDGRITSPH